MAEQLEINVLDRVPGPVEINRRLAQIEAESKILRRLLPLSLAVQDELKARADDQADSKR